MLLSDHCNVRDDVRQEAAYHRQVHAASRSTSMMVSSPAMVPRMAATLSVVDVVGHAAGISGPGSDDGNIARKL